MPALLKALSSLRLCASAGEFFALNERGSASPVERGPRHKERQEREEDCTPAPYSSLRPLRLCAFARASCRGCPRRSALRRCPLFGITPPCGLAPHLRLLRALRALRALRVGNSWLATRSSRSMALGARRRHLRVIFSATSAFSVVGALSSACLPLPSVQAGTPGP